jgi:hypothetical protein
MQGGVRRCVGRTVTQSRITAVARNDTPCTPTHSRQVSPARSSGTAGIPPKTVGNSPLQCCGELNPQTRWLVTPPSCAQMASPVQRDTSNDTVRRYRSNGWSCVRHCLSALREILSRITLCRIRHRWDLNSVLTGRQIRDRPTSVADFAPPNLYFRLGVTMEFNRPPLQRHAIKSERA